MEFDINRAQLWQSMVKPLCGHGDRDGFIQRIVLMTARDHLQGDPKILHTFCTPFTSSNIDQFSNFFNCQIQKKICNNNITKVPPPL